MKFARCSLKIRIFAVFKDKYIGDDTKAAARQSPNGIKKQKNKIWRKTIFNMADGILTPCNVARGSGITTVNSSSGSILQCNKWLWDDMPFHCIRPNVRHIGIILLVSISTISPQSTCHSASVCELLSKSDHQSGKNNVMSIFKMADLSHLEIYGSNNGFFGKPMYDFLLCRQ